MKVLLVDDHPMVRKGLASILSCEDNVEEIREASSIKEAEGLLSRYSPDVAIIDLRLGKEDGLEVVGLARRKSLSTKFIVLTSSIKKDDFMRAQAAEVDGYVLKDAFTEDILYAFHVVCRGRKFFEPELLESSYKENECFKDLTEREIEVLQTLGSGLSNNEIAKKLYISENTVKKHVSSILGKLRLNHRLEAAIYANKMLDFGQ